MIVLRRQKGRCLIVLFWAAMLWDRVYAGMDKTTAPTTSRAPTMPPSTLNPTLLPTTLIPTVEPTLSFEPSTSSKPSQQPTIAPTSTPVFVLSPSSPTVSVQMPQLTFILQTNGIVEEEAMKMALSKFLSNYLSKGTYKDSFRFLNLSSAVEQGNNILTISTLSGEAYFDSSNQEWPSVDVLANILSTYFSYWGDQNFKDFLIEQMLPVTSVTDVIVNGEKLTSVSDMSSAPAISPDTYSESDKSSTSDSDNFNAYAIAGIVIGGLVVVLAIALFIHTRNRQQRSLERNTGNEVVVVKPISDSDVEDEIKGQINTFPSGDSNDIDPDVITVNPSSPSPPVEDLDATPGTLYNEPPMTDMPVQIRMTQPLSVADDYNDGGAYSSDGDIISVTESLLYRDQDKQGPLFNIRSIGTSAPTTQTPVDETKTKGVSVRPAQQSVFQYDASRLDQVISQAKSTKDKK